MANKDESVSKHENSVPRHLGLILDGNRRWAKKQGLPKLQGHQKGYENLKSVVRLAFGKGVEYISAYIFSTENWNRSKEEVSYLMDFAYRVATKEVGELHKDNIRVRFLGSRDRLEERLLTAIDEAEKKTRKNDGGTLALCFNYGGQQEIVDAVNQIKDKPTLITAGVIEDHLYAHDIPPVDLVIRTSGEMRLSNFMLWRAAYAELYFSDVLWPAFSESDLDDALAEFASRQRRYGA